MAECASSTYPVLCRRLWARSIERVVVMPSGSWNQKCEQQILNPCHPHTHTDTHINQHDATNCRIFSYILLHDIDSNWITTFHTPTHTHSLTNPLPPFPPQQHTNTKLLQSVSLVLTCNIIVVFVYWFVVRLMFSAVPSAIRHREL